MKNILLFAVFIMFGCADLTMNKEKDDINQEEDSLISTEIKTGNNWRYLFKYYYSPRNYLNNSITIYSDIFIDSIWRNRSDTLFFTVSKIDSGTVQFYDKADSIFMQTQKILCKKTGIETSCSDDFLSSLFSDREFIQYDENTSLGVNYSHMINIQFCNRLFNGVEIDTHVPQGLSMSQMYSHKLFADAIGIVSDSSHYSDRYDWSTTVMNLLKYNGTDFSYTTTPSIQGYKKDFTAAVNAREL